MPATPGAAQAILRDLANAAIAFEDLAAEINKPSKSLHRMLAPHGDPGMENCFGLVMRAAKEDAHEAARVGQGRVKTVECQDRRQEMRRPILWRFVDCGYWTTNQPFGTLAPHGEALLPDLFVHLNPMTRQRALATEIALAHELRQEGFAVWQN